jgi:hypothetical protein
MPAPLPLPEYRACPHCAEPILVEARLCKHCHKSVPPLPQPEAQVTKRGGWKAAGGFLFAVVAWTVYYHYTWTPPAPTTQGQLARPAATVLAIKPQQPGAKPATMAKTFIENITNTTIAANEAAMLSHLRTVNTAQVLYDATYNSGFAPSLAALNKANMIDSRLASGRADDYIFYYKPGGLLIQIKTYWLWARPSAYNRTAIASCVTNETGEIHCTNEDRYATFLDPIH